MEENIPDSLLHQLSQFTGDGFWLLFPNAEDEDGKIELVQYKNGNAPAYFHLTMTAFLEKFIQTQGGLANLEYRKFEGGEA